MNYIRENIDVVKLFGKDRAQEDENLKHYFVKTKQYEEIASGSRELVLGRKGSGKSAMFKVLAEDSSEAIPVQISFDGEDFVFIQNALKNNNICELVNDDFKYSLAWKDFIISEIVLSALNAVDTLDGELSTFLSKHGLIKEKTWRKFAHSLIKVVKGAKLQSGNGEIEFDFAGLSDILEQDRVSLNDSINKLIRTNNFKVLIDNLDEPWKNTPDMNSWLRGLLYAIRQLKREFNKLKIVAFLRTDIYDIISRGSDLFDSKSEITTITWDDSNFYNLKLLVANRIAYYFEKDLPSSSDQIQKLWDMVFPHSLNYGYKHTELLANYLIDRTFRRPRELLQFCRQILTEGKSRYIPVEENAVSPAEIIYSEWKLSDLTGEYSKSFSNIDKCIQSFIGAKKTWNWPVTEILDHLSKVETQCKIFDSTTAQVLSNEDCIDVLYRIGFFRKVNSKHPSRDRYRLHYQDPSINYQLSVFDIHPAFRKKFVQY